MTKGNTMSFNTGFAIAILCLDCFFLAFNFWFWYLDCRNVKRDKQQKNAIQNNTRLLRVLQDNHRVITFSQSLVRRDIACISQLLARRDKKQQQWEAIQNKNGLLQDQIIHALNRNCKYYRTKNGLLQDHILINVDEINEKFRTKKTKPGARIIRLIEKKLRENNIGFEYDSEIKNLAKQNLVHEINRNQY